MRLGDSKEAINSHVNSGKNLPTKPKYDISYIGWEVHDEYRILLNGRPIGQSLTEDEAIIISQWLKTAIDFIVNKDSNKK
jgi:hypothetical protein